MNVKIYNGQNGKGYLIIGIIEEEGGLFMLSLIPYKCPFSYFLGIPCPGCGMTRAFSSLFQLDIEEAFYYHPLFPLVIFLLIAYFLTKFRLISVSARTKKLTIGISCTMFFGVYFIRLFSGSEIVQFHFSTSVLGEILHSILIVAHTDFVHYIA